MSVVIDETTKIRAEEDRANCCSGMFYTWLSPLFVLASSKTSADSVISQDDLTQLPSKDQGDLLSKTFQQSWDKHALLAKTKFNLQRDYTLNMDDPDDPDEQPMELATGCYASCCRCFCRGCSRVYQAYMCGGCKLKPPAKPMSRSKKARMWLLKKAAFGVMGPSVWRTAGLVKLANSTSQFCFPIFLSLIVSFIQGDYNENPNAMYIGLGFCFTLFLAMCLKAVLENQYFHLVVRGGFQLRSALSTAIYSKSLRLTAASRQTKTLGEIVNLMQIDASKMEGFVTNLHVIWDGMYQITGYVIILVVYIGWPALVGVLFMIIAMPVQKEIMMKQYMVQKLLFVVCCCLLFVVVCCLLWK